MADSRKLRLITKRTSVPGKIPTGTTGNESSFIQAGELASNLSDYSLWGYNGTDVFEYGSKSFFGLEGGTISGDTRIIGNISAVTFFSGSTDVETIIRNLIAADTHTFVQPGSNIITGGTPSSPIISTVDSPSFNNIEFSGTATGGDVYAANVSGDTFYSGSTELSEIIDNQIDTALSAFTSSYFDGYDNVGGTVSNTTAWTSVVPLNVQREIANDFTHSTVTNNSEVTIDTDNKYVVIGRVSGEGLGSTSRTQGECRLEIDTGGGFAEVPGTVGQMYIRQTSYGATASFQAVLDLNAGDKLRITFRRQTGTAPIELQPGGSSLTIARSGGGAKGDKGTTGDLNLNGFEDFYVSGTTFSNVFSGNTQEAVYYGDGSNLDGLSLADVPYMVWAEESGDLINGSRNWSFGNGATGAVNVFVMYDALVTKMFIQAEVIGATASIDLMINDVVAGTASYVGNGIVEFPAPINVFEGDELGFQTNTVVGTWSDVRVGVSIVNTLSGLKGEKGDTGSITGATYVTVSGTVFSDVYSGLTTEAVYYGDGENLTDIEVSRTVIKASPGVINADSVVYVVGYDFANDAVTVELADASSSATMPAFGILKTTITDTATGLALQTGLLGSFDTSSYVAGQSVYVSTTAGEITGVKPTGATDSIQKLGTVTRVDVALGNISVVGAGRTNDVPNITNQNFWMGDSSNYIQEVTIDSLPSATPISGDSIMIWDASTSSHRKTDWSVVSNIGLKTKSGIEAGSGFTGIQR